MKVGVLGESGMARLHDDEGVKGFVADEERPYER